MKLTRDGRWVILRILESRINTAISSRLHWVEVQLKVCAGGCRGLDFNLEKPPHSTFRCRDDVDAAGAKVNGS